MRLAGVFNQKQLVLLRNLEKRIHIRGLPVKMDGNDRGNRLASRCYKSPPPLSVDRARLLQVLPHLSRVHVVRPFVDIHESGFGSGL